MRFFPPIVTGPVIICIGLTLSSGAINNCATNWWIALVAIAIVIVCNIWGKGMIKILPILLGVVVSYVVAAITGTMDPLHCGGCPLDRSARFRYGSTVFALFPGCDTSLPSPP